MLLNTITIDDCYGFRPALPRDSRATPGVAVGRKNPGAGQGGLGAAGLAAASAVSSCARPSAAVLLIGIVCIAINTPYRIVFSEGSGITGGESVIK
jgi:hypothetical protein